MKNEITTFNYGLNRVRTIIKEGEPWFVLKDVCDVLEIRNVTQVADRLDEDEKSNVYQTYFRNSGLDIPNRGLIIINESGLYNVILRSDKPEAKRFKKWVTSEVLPSIRKTGTYSLAPKSYIEALKALIVVEEQKEQPVQENSALKIELDQDKQYYTIKRVASMNQISWRSISWKNLINTSRAMELEVKKVFDPNLTRMNAYHIDVWIYEYPKLKYAE